MTNDLDRPADPLLDELGAANPISERAYAGAALPPLGPLPARAPSPTTRRRVAVAGALSMAVALGVAVSLALAPSSTPGGDQVLQRALAAGGDGEPAILHWRSRTEQDGLESSTDDAYLHVNAGGDIDRFHELRLDGSYKGIESVVTQPHGVGNLTGANDRTRRGPDKPIRESPGYGLPNIGFAAVIATVQAAADSGFDTASAKEVTYAGRDAYAVTIRDAKRNPAVPDPDGGPARPAVVTVWIARDDYTPLAVRYADDLDRTFLVEKVLSFERLPDDAEHQALLDFAPAG